MILTMDQLAKASRREVVLELNRLRYEGSLYQFFTDAWPCFDSAPFTHGMPLQAVCEHLEAVSDGHIKRLIINIPPRMSKSSMTSVCFPAWVWSRRNLTPTSGAGVPFLHASYSQQLSLRDSVKCRRLIESPFYQNLWSDRFQLTSDQNTKTRFDNDKNGTRLCTSVGATLTGEGGNIIIVDDPNAAQEAFSEATIETTIDWWDNALSTRLNDPKSGAFIVIQQRLAENDLTGHILEKQIDGWDHLMLPMHYEPDRSFYTSIGWKDWRTEPGELLWPERFAETQVKQLEKVLGPYGAAGQLEQRPEVKGGGIIKREDWQLWEGDRFPHFDFILASLDTAFTEKTHNDPSAITIWGVFAGSQVAAASQFTTTDGKVQAVRRTYDESAPKVMLMHAWEERLELHDLVAKVGATCKKYKIDMLVIENKASGISVAQEIRRLFQNENWSVVLNDPKSQDKMSRLYSIQHIFAEEIVYAPDRSWADKVITQCAGFPKLKHDDLVDTTSQGIRKLREMGLLIRAPERVVEVEAMKRLPGKPPPPLYPT